MDKKQPAPQPEAPPPPKPPKALDVPPGFTLRHTLRGHTGWIGRLAWSPDGRFLATPSQDGTVRVWDAQTGQVLCTLKGHTRSVYAVSWSPDGRFLVSAEFDEDIHVWHAEDGQHVRTLKGHTEGVVAVAWSPDGRLLASAGYDRTVRVWNAETGRHVSTRTGHTEGVVAVAWSPDGRVLASAGFDGIVQLWGDGPDTFVRSLIGHVETVCEVAWSPDGRLLASAGGDGTVRVWSAETGRHVRTLEGHTGGVMGVSWSPDGRLLASKSFDDTIRLWRGDTWAEVAALTEGASSFWCPSLMFHPSRPVLATFTDRDSSVRIWDLDIDLILGRAPAAPATAYTSAKVVLLGDSNVGKSCLASQLVTGQRLAEGDLGTTHGMRIWKKPAGAFHASATAPPGEDREVFFWDFGGQPEYQLVHQMFLHDTALALILFDPTRSGAERDQARAWNLRLGKQTGARPVVKFLVGAQVDDAAKVNLIDRAAVDKLCFACGFQEFFPTSGLTGFGVEELRAALAKAIDWSLGQTTRPELFQRIREQVDAHRTAGEVVVTLRAFNDTLRAKFHDIFAEDAARAVTDQLAGQGLLAKTQTKDGDEALVLRVDVVEQYAAALVLLARNNPRGVPALPETDLGTRQKALPGIEPKTRLPWEQERVVLECVTELMIRHGVCFRHQGLLVFPTLFPEAPNETEAEKLAHTVSIWYDFTGTIDNVFASLVGGLMVLHPFGPGRLSPGRAEFDDPDRGLCGLRRLRRDGGLAHIELFFGPKTAQGRRDEFTAYVEAHLREHGVEVTECRAIKCAACGRVITEETVRDRIALGRSDVRCVCDHVTPISEGVLADGVAGARKRDPQTDAKVFALRQQIKEQLTLDALTAKAVISAVAGDPLDERSINIQIHTGDRFDIRGDIVGSAIGREAQLKARDIRAESERAARVANATPGAPGAGSTGATRVRILHLSDLHFTARTNWAPHLDALLHDLCHPDLGCDVVHHLVVSGDFIDKGQAGAFHPAREFVSALRERLGISIERVVLVPGNHDVVDDGSFYKWEFTDEGLKPGEYVAKEGGFLARNPKTWPKRFKPFSDHLYHPLFQQPYPLPPEGQGQGFPAANTHIQFLAFNSAWAVDQTDRKRSGLHGAALMKGINAADKHRKEHPSPREPLRVAVWHHAMLHPDGMADEAPVGHLTKAGVRLVLHGDVHEANPAVNPFRWPGLVVLGAGAFGAGADARPESMPGLYQVIELHQGDGPGGYEWARVHTRAREQVGGPWGGWFRWPDPEGGNARVAHFDVDLITGAPRASCAKS
ncbi:MAG TPA: metallophosphoesterase [Gemmata sp.]